MDVIRYATEILIDGTAVAIASEPSISADIDTFGTVVEFELASRPTVFPDEGTTVQVNRVKLSDDTYHVLFGGYIGGGTDVESEPWDLKFRALDELSKFSALRTTNDLNLTGMTDGEAWEAIANVCDVDFDHADIVDTGYVLGAKMDVWWKKETTGQSVIEELDRVFQCKTMAVQNNRVVRFVYDRVAHSADIFSTYTKAESNEFLQNHLNRGDKSQAQSLWTVQGVSAPCGTDNACTCMVWATSTDVVPVRGKKIRRIPASQFPQSDLIQDENLARLIAQRMMRWFNRVPKTYSITSVTNANMYPGMVVGIVDLTYGMDATSTVPAFVSTVEKAGSTMTLTAIGAPGGSTGSTTSGVEKRCNKTNTDLDWEGDWELPALDFPELDDFADWFGDFDFSLPVYGGTEDSMCNSLLGSSWTNDNDVWGPVEAGSYAFPGNIVGTVAPIEDPYLGWGIEMFGDAEVLVDEDWLIHIAGTHTLDAGMIALQLIDNSGGGGPFIQSVSFQVGAPGIDEVTEFTTESDFDDPAATLDTGAFELILDKTADSFEATYKGDGGVVLYNHTLDSTDWNSNASGSNLQIGIVSWTEGTGGSVLLTTVEVCPKDEDEIIFDGPMVWVDDPEWPDDFSISGNDLDAAPFDNATAFTTTTIPRHSSGLAKSFQLTYNWSLDALAGGIELIAEDENDPDIVFFWQPFFDDSTGCYFLTGATYSGSATDDPLDFGSVTAPDASNMEIIWNRVAQTFTVSRDGSAQVTSATDPGLTGDVKLVCIAGGGAGACFGHDFTLTMLE